jgi:glycosyltransferase involved in cell wall biosynthesis
MSDTFFSKKGNGLKLRSEYPMKKTNIEKILLVTFPTDLGNTTFEERLIYTLNKLFDLKVYRFTATPRNIYPNRSMYHFAIVSRRLVASFELCKEIFKARLEHRKIIFQGVSPALYGLPAALLMDTYILTDWTRKLYETIWKTTMSPPYQTYIHSKVLENQKYILCFTDAVLKNIEQDYKIPKSKLKRVKLPFNYDLQLFQPSLRREDSEVRILFVGGKFKLKGGDILCRWFTEKSKILRDLKMTVLTHEFVEIVPGITVIKNINYGSAEHVNIFREHDIFVLPTTIDSFPSVLGEAACAGLAILTTRYALGAPEIVQNGLNGYISDSQEELINKLDDLVKDKESIELMKKNSRLYMENRFNFDSVAQHYIEYIC